MYKVVGLAVILILIFYFYRYFYSPEKWVKPKVDVVRREEDKDVIIFSAYDKEFSKKEYVQKNFKILKDYSETNGHEYRQFITDDDISPYWVRVKILKELMKDTKENTLIVYFDADAIPAHRDISVKTFISSLQEDKADIFISEDPEIEWNPVYHGIFNTGVFIFRNTVKSREFVDKWLAMYDEEKWEKTVSGWKCKQPCFYSGINYEQGAFTELYNKIEDKSIIRRLNSSTLDCRTGGDDCFAIHLMNEKDIIRDEIFSKKVIFSGLPG